MKRIIKTTLLCVLLSTSLGLGISNSKSNNLKDGPNPNLSTATINDLFRSSVKYQYNNNTHYYYNVSTATGARAVDFLATSFISPTDNYLLNFDNSDWSANPPMPPSHDTGYDTIFPTFATCLGGTIAPGTKIVAPWYWVIGVVYFQLNQIYFIHDNSINQYALLFNWEKTDPPSQLLNHSQKNNQLRVNPNLSDERGGANDYEILPDKSLTTGASLSNFMLESTIPSKTTAHFNLSLINIYRPN